MRPKTTTTTTTTTKPVMTTTTTPTTTIRTLRDAYLAGRLATRNLLDPARTRGSAKLVGALREAYELGCRERGGRYRCTDVDILAGIITRLRRERDEALDRLVALTSRPAA